VGNYFRPWAQWGLCFCHVCQIQFKYGKPMKIKWPCVVPSCSKCTIEFYNVFNRCAIEFTNILRAAFSCKGSKSAKPHLRLDSLFVLLRSAHEKAVCKHVDEIDPWVKIQNVLSKFVRFFINLRCFYKAIINRK